MTDLRILSSLALASTLAAIGPAFEAAHAVRIAATLLPTALLLSRIEQGERGDVAILTAAGVQGLAESGVLAPASVRNLAVSSVGIAVRHGAPKPPIATEAELVAALVAARSVGLSRAGASGLYFQQLLTRLGLAELVAAKAVVIESGYTAELAADGRAELCVQQVSELMMVSGIDVVGPLPPGLGAETVFAGGVFADAAQPVAAAALLALIGGAPDTLRAHGLAPV